MPLTLRDLQSAFAAHLAGQARPDLEAVVAGGAIPAAARLRIHRHHVLQSLTAALATTFPTVRAVVGEGFFRAMATAFVERELPRQPVLAEYGAAFPSFIDGHEPAATLPYLGDVARLDWALNEAFDCPPDGRLAAADLATMPAERLPGLTLALSEGTKIVRSRYPIDDIWRASQPGAPDDLVDLAKGGVSLLVSRRADDAVFVNLSEPEAAFVEALRAGARLDEAAATMDGSFDLSTGFARLLGFQAFAALR